MSGLTIPHKNDPRLLTHLSQEPNLRETFEKGRDPYATLCAPAFHLDYWDCMEHTKDGEPNPDGKKMRSKGKVLMLGISYGMGPKNMSVQMGIPYDECKEVLKNFYENFPKLKEFGEYNNNFMQAHGYVEDYLGRRRHLPDALLPEIEVVQKKSIKTNSDYLFDIDTTSSYIDVPDEDKIKEWTNRWNNFPDKNNLRGKQKFKKDAELSGIELQDNGGYIAKTRTQCLNASIQGSAASLTKKAMVSIFRDEEINKLGFRILIPVHDELLGECPKANAERVSQRLSELMISATKPEVSVKFKCDPYIAKHWYADEVENEIRNTYLQYLKGNKKKNIEPLSEKEALKKLKDEYSELSADTVEQMCLGIYDVMKEEV